MHGFAPRVGEVRSSSTATADHLRSLFAAGRPIVGICAAGVLIRSLAPLLDRQARGAAGRRRGRRWQRRRAASGRPSRRQRSGPPDCRSARRQGGHHHRRRSAPWRRPRRSAAGLASRQSGGGESRHGCRCWQARPSPSGTTRLSMPVGFPALALAIKQLPNGESSSPRRRHVRRRICSFIPRRSCSASAASAWRRHRRGDRSGRRLARRRRLLAAVGGLRRLHRAESGGTGHPCSGRRILACRRASSMRRRSGTRDAAAGQSFRSRVSRNRLPWRRRRRGAGRRRAAGTARAAASSAAAPCHLRHRAVAPHRRSGDARPAPRPALHRRPRSRDAAKPHAGSRGAHCAWRPIGSATSSISICWRRSPPARRSTPSNWARRRSRVAHALDLAATGRDVALISSGDAGIYAMAALVFELIERGGRHDWARLEIIGLPGVSAMQVAAARIGAPLGHDFCAISLSDLLTPVAGDRAAAAARRPRRFRGGSLQSRVAAPTPAARRRARYPADSTVPARRRWCSAAISAVPARACASSRWQQLDPEQVDMLTVVLIGASTTRAFARPDGGQWVYTPRGYAAKKEGAA